MKTLYKSDRKHIQFGFFLFDFWVGGYKKPGEPVLYICPLPCCVFKIEWNLKRDKTIIYSDGSTEEDDLL